MLIPGHRIPLSAETLYSGLARLDGLLSATQEEIIIEFQTQDNVLRIFKGRTGTLRIPYKELYQVELKANWLRRKLIIRPNSLRWLENMPGASDGAITLSVKRKDLHSAKELTSYIQLRISEVRLEQLDEE